MNIREQAARFISESATAEGVGVLCRGDVDAVAAAVIISKAINRLGGEVAPLFLGRGLSPYSPQSQEELRRLGLSRLIIVDSGSRKGEVVLDIPTLVIDHHRPLENPEVSVFFNTTVDDSLEPTSLAAYEVCQDIIDISDLIWVAAIGVIGDLGPRAPFPIIEQVFNRYGRMNLADSVVLINAGIRHHDYKIDLSYSTLSSASSAAEIAEHKASGSGELERLRREVQDEL